MREIKADIAVIGAGPAGLAAAIEAKRSGAQSVVLLERDQDLGGILNQCIHDGFGLLRFQKQLSGCEYAGRFIHMLEGQQIETFCDTMVLEMTADRKIYAVSGKEGAVCIQAGAIILAMGCRERTRPQVRIFGSRPAGVLTAGAVQKYINIEGYLPGKRAVILGSGDIGLIMARRMTLEGIAVEGVYEVMASPGGLRRNVVQCLEDYDIPLHLSTTVTKIHGKKRVEAVTVARVDEQRRPIPGTEREIPCDLLVLSVGLIPENELSRQAGVRMDPVTKGPAVDSNMMTSLEGVFAAGNVAAVFDLVDYVSNTGEQAARGALRYIKGELAKGEAVPVRAGENVSFVLPQQIAPGSETEFDFYMRVKKPLQNVDVRAICGGVELGRKHCAVANPPEMIHFHLRANGPLNGPVEFTVTEKTKKGGNDGC